MSDIKQLTEEEIFHSCPAAFASAPHSERSENYAVVKTIDTIRAMELKGWAVREAIQVKGRTAERQGTNRHMVRFFRADGSLTLRDSQIEVLLTNSVNGATAYRLGVGLYRFVCLNGMVVHDGIFAEARFNHFEDIVKGIIDETEKVASYGLQIAEHVNVMKETFPSFDDRFKFAVAATKLIKNEHVDPASLLETRRSEDNAFDAWTCLNVVQENIIKGGIKYHIISEDENNGEKKVRGMTTRPVSEIRVNTNINRALFESAETLLLAA
jgi:hypothetical protein